MRTWPRELEVSVDPGDPLDSAHLRTLAGQKLGVDPDELPPVELLRRSLDARHGRVRLRLLLGISADPRGNLADPPPRECQLPARVVIVGDGPGGLFCAYELARRGVASIVLDRGKTVQPRRHDLKGLHRRGEVDPDSNYCFGEGGAGTYSDGKLYTRSHKRGNVRDVLEILAAHGAPPEILVDARPHVGSNRLPKVVTAIREHLESVGVSFRFGAKVVDVLSAGEGSARRVTGVRLADGSEIGAEHVVLATGHSARDVFELVGKLGVGLEAKPFAMGVRIEHPQPLIDRLQYKRLAGHPALPAAAYRVAHEVEGRGVFSFCMCPGGFVVPASTAPEELVVNGMSLTRRAGAFANSGLVVSVEPEDVARAGHAGVLGGIYAQRALERAAFRAGGGALRAPATRVPDFLRRRASSTVPETSYIPGLEATDLRAVLDAAGLTGAGVGLAERLRRALEAFGKHMPAFVSEDAVLIGVETRTSSPVRIIRDPERLMTREIAGLYPCGEGAGHAGGIVSAAVDGIRIATAIAPQISR
jgi:uncharacterized FAD-dependent dehydrogenase